MRPKRNCCTVQLDSRVFYLSTLLLVRGPTRRHWTKAMWQKLSLRARLNMLLALILALGLAINIARLVLEAAPRVQAEDQSVIRLAREFLETLVAGLNETPDPDARLDQIVQDLNRSEERRVGKECRSLCDWSSDVCSSDLKRHTTGARISRNAGRRSE